MLNCIISGERRSFAMIENEKFERSIYRIKDKIGKVFKKFAIETD